MASTRKPHGAATFLSRPGVLIAGALAFLVLVGLTIAVLVRLVLWRAGGDQLAAVLPATVTSPTPQPTATPTAAEFDLLPLTPVAAPLTSTPYAESPLLTPTALPLWAEDPLTYGYSYNGAPLEVYRFGHGASVRLIVGGIHGGYEWNTIELVTQMIDYLNEHPELVPDSVTLYVIPNMNPDGYVSGTDPVVARMNGNGVDLNRNWDYQWQRTATHGTRPVKAGESPWSEPETLATRDFMLEHGVTMVIFYHSAMGVVFSGADRASSWTYELTTMLSEATGYPHQEGGIVGQITTGDAIDWASTVGIAGTEIELTTHAAVSLEEWQRNLRGLEAFLLWTPPVERDPSGGDADRQASSPLSHAVQDGDTLSGIAAAYGVTLDALMTANGLDDADLIRIGQILTIPLPALPEDVYGP